MIKQKNREQLVDDYIRAKHNQDECSGFIDGLNAYEKALKNMESSSRIIDCPTDERIESEAKARYNHSMASIAESVHGESAFIEGAAWMRDMLDCR